MPPRALKFIKFALPLAVSLALLLWLALHIDFSVSYNLLRSMPAGLAVTALLFMFLSSVLSSLRFWLLVKPQYPITWYESAGLNLLTVLSAHGLGILSDGLRVHYLMRFGASLRQSIDLTLADRLLSLWLFSLCTLLLMPCALMSMPLAYAASAVGIILLLAGAWLCSRRFWPAWVLACFNCFTQSIGNSRKLLLQLTCALLCCLAIAAAFMALALALDFKLPLTVALAIAPLAVLVSSIPFTYAGLGAREATFVFGLPLISTLSAEQAAALSLGFAALLLTANIPGLLFIPRLARK